MKTKKYFTIAAAALILAACSNEDVPVVDHVTDTPIRVHTAIASLDSRAGIESESDFSMFYMSVTNASSDTYSYSNIAVTKSGDTWTPEQTMLWQNSETAVAVTAATFSLSGAQTLGVKADQSNAANVIASDHLFMPAATQSYEAVDEAENVMAKAAGAVNVNFSHLMAKVILTITLGNEFNETENPISNVTFKGTVASNNYTVGTGWATIAEDAATTDITPLCNAYTALTTDKPNATAEYEVILVPQTVAADGFTVTFNVGDRVFKWTSASAVTLEGGNKYSLALTAGKDIVSSAAFSASAWNTGEGDNNNLSGETE